MQRTLCAALAFAAAATTVAAAQDQRTYATVVLNGVTGGQSLVLVRDTGIAIDAATLDALNIPHANAPVTVIRGITYVSLDALAPALSYRFDSQKIELALQLSTALLPKNTVAISRPQAAGVRTPIAATTLNYSLSAVPNASVAASFDARYAARNDAFVRSTFGRTIFGRIARGFTTFEHDDRAHLREMLAGDVVTGGGRFYGGATLGGVAFRRSFDLDPYQVYFPTPALNTTITSPTVAQIYVNGALVQTLDLQPGNYTIQDIPVRSGYTNAQVVLVDTFGNSSVQSRSFTSSTTLLRPGLTDYEIAVGALRANQSAPGDHYGPAAASATYRIGLSGRLTAGAHAEVAPFVTDGGASFGAIVGRTIVSGDLAASREGSRGGAAVAFSMQSQGLATAWSVTAQAQTQAFSTLLQRASYDRPLLSLDGNYSARAGRYTTFTFSGGYSFDRDNGALSRATLGFTRPLGALGMNASFNLVSTMRDGMRHVSPGITLRFFRAFGREQVAATTTSDENGRQSSFELHRSSGAHLGSTEDVVVDAQTLRPRDLRYTEGLPAMRVSAGVTRDSSGRYVPSAAVSGAVTYAENAMFFTQPVYDASIVVQAPGLARAPVVVDGEVVAMTDRHGKALIPYGRANEANGISIEEAALPQNAQLEVSEVRVIPSRYGTASATFAVERIHSATGFIAANGNRYSGGTMQLTIQSQSVSIPLDSDGRFYIGSIDAGTYDGIVSAGDRSCKVRIVVPQFEGLRVSLGPVACVDSP